VGFKPGFGPVEQHKQVGVAGRFGEFGVGLFLFDPTDGRSGVGVNGDRAALLVEQSQGVNDGQKLADVVGAVGIRTFQKQLLLRGQIDALVFHVAGGRVPGRIDY